MQTGKGISVFENLDDIRKYLSVVNYPASKEDIFRKAQEYGANINVMTLFQILPEGRTYHTPKDALKAMGISHE